MSVVFIHLSLNQVLLRWLSLKPSAKHENLLICLLTSDFFFQWRIKVSLYTDISHSAAFTWVPPLSRSQRQIPAMACRAHQAQPETRPELARCCQKELLLNVRGFASTQKRDFNAFVQ